jgi:hypothetical protein
MSRAKRYWQVFVSHPESYLVRSLQGQSFDNADLLVIGEEIEPGQAAVLAIVQDKSVEQFATAISGYAKLLRQTVDAEVAGELALVTDKVTGEVDATMIVTGQYPPPQTTGAASSETAS